MADAYRRARETDPVSAFGGIVAVNRPVDGELAREIAETFLECVIAPGVRARRRCRCSRRARTCACWSATSRPRAPGALELRSVAGGFLVQTRDRDTAAAADGEGRLEARRRRAEELRDLDFAWRVCKHVKSNAIVFAARRPHAGHRRRPDVARRLGAHRRLEGARAAGRARCVASDAFFPFRDGVDEAAKAGAAAVIQPGGSVRDAEVDRRRRRARHGDGVHRRAPLPALADARRMRILLVGSGGREHALAWKLGAEPAVRAIVVRAGQPRHRRPSAKVSCMPIAADATAELVAAAVAERADLVVCGPEAPLVAGLGDAMRAAGMPFFGPSRAAAEIEGSKAFAKRLMRDAGVPDRGVRRASTDVAAADAFIDAQPGAGGGQGRRPRRRQGRGRRRRRKAEAKAAVRAMLAERAVRRRRRAGRHRGAPHRARGDDDGAVRRHAPGAARVVRGSQGGRRRRRRAEHGRHGDGVAVAAGRRRGSRSGSLETLFVPTVRALAEAGRPFRGLLYGGLMLTPDRGPMVIEWNCRFGDPETQSVLMRFDERSAALAGGRRRRARCRRACRARARASALCVVLAAGGYPGKPRAGRRDHRACRREPPTTSSCSTPARAATATAALVTAGGRVLGVTAVRRRPDGGARRAPTGRSTDPLRWHALPPRHRPARENDMSDRRKLDVAIMMGSKSDLETMQPAAKVLEKLGLAVEVRVLSAHRTPEEAAAFVQGRRPARRQGVHLRRGRRGPPGGRGRGAHHAPGHRRPDRRRAAWAGSTRCCRRCRCRRACRWRRSPIGGAENAGLLAAQIIAVGDAALAQARRGRAGRPPQEGARQRRRGPRQVRADRTRGASDRDGARFDEEIVFAVAALRRGEVVAYPTETFYGLGVDALDELALARLRALKGRDEKAISVLVDGPAMLDRCACRRRRAPVR